MKRLLMILGLVLLLMCNMAFGQHYTDWTGFEYLPGRYDSHERIVFYELQKDYTINLSEYFLNSEKLPDCCEDKADYYRNWANALPPLDWDFIRIEFGGILTIKKGYRWDGASYLCKKLLPDLGYCPDEYHNFRSSLVHDVLYDLMRMGYIPADHHHQVPVAGDCLDTHILWDAGDHNRRFADMIHYMIAIEDGDPKDDAQSDYFWLRVWGACATHDDDKLSGWKYHVSELTAYSLDGKVELEWRRPNEAGKDPDFSGHFSPMTGYRIYRNGQEIAAVGVWHFDPPNPPEWITSYTDNTAVNGDTYGYQIIPHPDNQNQDDWSNVDFAAPVDGPGNALQLDGINDYLEANTTSNDLVSSLYFNPFPVSVTLEAWVYPASQTVRSAVLAFNTISGGNYNMIFYDGESQKFCYYDPSSEYIYSTEQSVAEQWYHVAVTINMKSEGILYINGTQQATFDTPTRPSHGAQFSIGQEWDNSMTSQHFKGEIDEVRIWNVARTQSEIQASMYNPLRGDETGLVGLWHFDELNFSTFHQTHDATSNANDGDLLGYADSDVPFVLSGAMKQPTDISEQTDDDLNHIPIKYALDQNYPNPFNPATKIEFAIPRTAFVRLDIFNILGEKVETLLSKRLSAGNYSVTWDATDAPSGIYFYKIEAGTFSETKKMTLIK